MRKLLLLIFIVSIFAGFFFVQFASAQNTAQQQWVVDEEVTFVGKNAARLAAQFDKTIQNYDWVCINRDEKNQCIGSLENNLLLHAYYFIAAPLALLVALIVLIKTRKKPFAVGHFLKRFGLWTLLILCSYFIVVSIYQISDSVQGFLFRTDPSKVCPPACITQTNLLHMRWSADDFIGVRLTGVETVESGYTSLLLVKLTTLLYSLMAGILLLRKIVLWLFIIVAPFIVLLLLIKPIRNIGKLILGEFLVWILYAPVFALFLNIVSFLWRNGIPSYSTPVVTADKLFFPTAVNMLIGIQRQQVTPTNTVSIPETFFLYVLALITLLIVVFLPWVILRVIVDYAVSYQKRDKN